jgi:hypothetical protein
MLDTVLVSHRPRAQPQVDRSPHGLTTRPDPHSRLTRALVVLGDRYHTRHTPPHHSSAVNVPPDSPTGSRALPCFPWASSSVG